MFFFFVFVVNNGVSRHCDPFEKITKCEPRGGCFLLWMDFE